MKKDNESSEAVNKVFRSLILLTFGWTISFSAYFALEGCNISILIEPVCFFEIFKKKLTNKTLQHGFSLFKNNTIFIE